MNLLVTVENYRLWNSSSSLSNSLSVSFPDANTKRESGKVAQLNNIAAAKVSILDNVIYESIKSIKNESWESVI